MTVLVEIVCSVSQEEFAQAAVEAFCKATGGLLIGRRVIESFRHVTCDLVQISFDPSVNLREQMRNFPLRPDESWFHAIHDPDQAYVCLSKPLMEAKQAALLLAHGVKWAFV